MKLRSKEPYWLLKNGMMNTYPSLRKNAVCDILIVGGGITGSLMAFQLSQEGYQTILIDKRDVSLGSTSATTSLLQYELDEPLYSLIDKVGKAAAVDTYLGCAESIQTLSTLIEKYKFDCGFTWKDSLYIAREKKHVEWMRKEFVCRKEIGIDASWLSKEEVKARYGMTSHGGILSKTGASMDAYRLSHFLFQHASEKFNLQVYDHTELLSVRYDSDHTIATTEYSYTITCKQIVYATGYETQDMLPKKVVDLISTYACISEPMSHIPEHLTSTLFWDTGDPYFYMRSTSDGRLLMGGEDVSFKNPTRRDRLIDKKEEKLVERVKQLAPDIDFIPDLSWTGTFGVTKDSLPYIGPHESFPNSYFVLGFGGNGITFSVMGMQIISDAIAGKPNRFLEHFRFNR